MAISHKDLENGYLAGKEVGIAKGKELAKEELKNLTRSSLQELLNSAALLAKANASLTYSMSRMIDKLS